MLAAAEVNDTGALRSCGSRSAYPCPQNHTFGRQKSSFWRMRRRLQRGFVPPVVQERSTGHTKKEVGVEEVDLISSAFGDAHLGRHAGRSAGYAGGRAGR